MKGPSAEERARIMKVLKEYAGAPDPPYDPQHRITKIQEAKVSVLNAALVVNELANIGVIIAGQRKKLNITMPEGSYFQGSVHEQFNWPDFTITPFGIFSVLSARTTGVATSDASDHISTLKMRMPDAPQVVEQYATEAKRAFDRGLWLAVSVLLGVASEALLETMYSSLAEHLKGERKAIYAKKLAQLRNAQPRYDLFVSELDVHKMEFTADVWQRRESLLDALAGLLKVNRDDVAHRRTTRIDQDTALAAITSFPALVQLVRELNDGLKNRCTVTR